MLNKKGGGTEELCGSSNGGHIQLQVLPFLPRSDQSLTKRNDDPFLSSIYSGTKPGYLGVQKISPSLALCPATSNCVSTSEDIRDTKHYAPPWNYNGRREKTISRKEAVKELLQVLISTKPDNFTPRLVEKKDDYIRVEYESPIFGFVDDAEFWFPPGKRSLVEYRSASRSGTVDFDVNRKRIKKLREELEKKGWASESSF